MKILLKIFASILALCAAAVVAGLLWASHYVDSPQFRSDLFNSLSRITGREVRLHGELDVTIYPWLGLRAYDVTVANEPGFGDGPYVSYREVAFGVEVLPLFSRELVISEILIDGMVVNLIRTSESEVNWDYYQSASDASETPVFSYFERIFIEGVTVRDAVLTFDDGKFDENIRLHGLSARIGAFQPGDAAGFEVAGVFDRDKGNLEIELRISGILNTNIFSRSAMFDETSVELLVQGGGLPENEKARLVADLYYDQADDALELSNLHLRVFNVDASGAVELDDILSEWRITGRLETDYFAPRAILQQFKVNRPLDRVKGLAKAKIKTDFDATAEEVRFGELVLMLDETRLSGNVVLANYESPKLAFSLNGSRFDLDNYLPLFETGTPFIWDDFSLPFWGGLHASGDLNVQMFKVLDMEFGNVAARLDAGGGQISASAKGGALGGLLNADLSMGIDTKNDSPGLRTSLKAKIKSAKYEATPFIQGDWGKASGPVDLDLSLLINQPSCPAKSRSIDALRNMSVEFGLNSPGTALRLKDSKEPLEFDRVVLTLHATPAPSKGKDYLFNLNSIMRLEQRKSTNYGTATWNGPLAVNEDFDAVSSPGGAWTIENVGWLLPGLKDKVAAKGRASFAPNLKRLEMGDVVVNTMGATLNASFVADSPLEERRILDGKFSLYGFNPEAVIARYGVDVHEMEDESVFDHLTAHADFRYAGENLTLTGLKAQLDDTSIEGVIETKIQNPPDFKVDLKLGRADLDRYLTPDTEPDLEKLRAGIDEDAPPVKMPLEFLKWLTVSGSLRIEEFILQELKFQNLSGTVSARNGNIQINNLASDFYGGSMTGLMKGLVHQKDFETELSLRLKRFEAGPMLQDMVERDYLRGTTDMDIDIAGRGATDDEIVANLNGSIDLNIGKGSYKFMNWDAVVDPVKVANGAPDPRSQRTAFNSVTSKWVISNGYFDMKEFHLDGPLMTGTGHGGFSPSEESIDLSFRADFAAVPGVTVRIVGHIQDPEIRVPKGKIVTNTLENIISIPQKSLRFLRDLFF